MHQRALVAIGRMMLLRFEHRAAIGHAVLAVYSGALFNVVGHLLPLVQIKVVVMFIVREHSQLTILQRKDQLEVRALGKDRKNVFSTVRQFCLCIARIAVTREISKWSLQVHVD